MAIQYQNGIYSTHKLNTYQVFKRQRIIETLNKKLGLTNPKQVEKEYHDAIKLTRYFNELRELMQDMNNGGTKYIDNPFEEVILALQSKGVSSAFLRSGLGSNIQRGESFERDITNIINAAVEAAFNNIKIPTVTTANSAQQIGRVNTSIGTKSGEVIFGTFATEILKSIDDRFLHSLTAVRDAEDDSIIGYHLSLKQGKTDIKVQNLQYILSYLPNSAVKDFLKLISESSFTVKSLLVNRLNKGIDLGNTNRIRSITGAMAFINPTASSGEYLAIYRRVYSSLPHTPEKAEVELYTDQLVKAYELTGIGQIYEDLGVLGPPKFLIAETVINQKNDVSQPTDKIHVYSIKKLLQDYMNDTKHKSTRLYVSKKNF